MAVFCVDCKHAKPERFEWFCLHPDTRSVINKSVQACGYARRVCLGNFYEPKPEEADGQDPAHD